MLKTTGISLFILSFSLWIGTLFLNNSVLTETIFKAKVSTEHQALLYPKVKQMFNKKYNFSFQLSSKIKTAITEINTEFDKQKAWDKKINDPYEISLTKYSSFGYLTDNQSILLLLIFGIGTFGALIYIISDINSPVENRNDQIFSHTVTSKKWFGSIIGSFLILFYILLYFFPHFIVNWLLLLDPISRFLNGNEASQWFLYGVLYTLSVTVMGIRMLVKYRGNNYQQVRTSSIIFFQLIFAFLIPEILIKLHLPSADLKNMWPLDYSFFFDYRIDQKIKNGAFGTFLFVWGIALFLVGVPLFTYLFGKRWYCSWVCGCGGLAETLGDPFRQLSDKSIKAWKIERYVIHLVLLFAILMTIGVLYTYVTGNYTLLGFIPTESLKAWYGFWIGALFSGVVGTGFYPLMGNRVWCRFGCPLAAYMGIIQRFKSKFRITTNGGQCISCGNCSTYCEQGIDVRAYAQRGEDIVRASCVGCGICSAVCPRGVLNLENK